MLLRAMGLMAGTGLLPLLPLPLLPLLPSLSRYLPLPLMALLSSLLSLLSFYSPSLVRLPLLPSFSLPCLFSSFISD